MTTKRYCSACGTEMDADGICTNEKCPRRKIQIRQKAAKEAAKKAQEEAKAM